MSVKLFKISKPYGYHIPQVDETIARYNKALEDAKKIILKKDEDYKIIMNENKKLRETVAELEKTVQGLYLEMHMLEIPNMNSVQEQIIIDNFKDSIGKNEPREHQELTDSDFSKSNSNRIKLNFNIFKK